MATQIAGLDRTSLLDRHMAKHRCISLNKLMEEFCKSSLVEFDTETRFRLRAAQQRPVAGWRQGFPLVAGQRSVALHTRPFKAGFEEQHPRLQGRRTGRRNPDRGP